MKSKKELEELKSKDTKALVKELDALQTKLADVRLKSAFRTLKNTSEIGETRKKVARIWTILTDRAITEAKAKSEVTK